MAGYLFVHFTGEHEDGEQVYFSLSKDGLFWKDLNGGMPVLVSKIGERGVRDPFLVCGAKREVFYLMATDLRIAAGKGWTAAQYEGSRDMIVWESKDLVHWEKERSVRLGVSGAGCVWAPEAVYDREKECFFVFYASMVQLAGDQKPKQRIYGTYTKDFREFTKPFVYMEREQHVIDMTIVYADERYLRFSKDETNSRILLEQSKTLDGVFTPVPSPSLEKLEWVEGPECYLLSDQKTWCLITDHFGEGTGYQPLLSEHPASGEFTVLSDGKYDMGHTKKRHGGVLRLTDQEYERVKQAYGDKNPVLDGLYADPDLAYFDGTWYLYPTTDGYPGWSGTKFFVFTSKDGWHFQKAARVLDLATDEVPWAVGSAWAPCIAQKGGKYYFYFCGKDQNGVSCIGAAVADTPTGTFYAQPEPMITMEQMHRLKIAMSQTIDPSVYQEGEDTYLLFGNGEPAVVKLAEDMLHIQEDTLANLEGAYDFREAITVFRRQETYHFTWSCDDTGSENYHVNYGTAKSLYGPIHFEKTLLQKDGESLGTGHHALVYLPQEDRCKIAFHRLSHPEQHPRDAGGYREVCLCDTGFGSDGKMKKVVL